MELDDLKVAWKELDRKVTATHSAVLNFQADQKLDRARTALRPLVWRLTWELLKMIAVAVLCGWYLADNYQETRFAVPGIVLHALAILSVISTVRQLEMVRRIDYSAPVISIQRQLAELRALRLRTYLAVLALAPLLWILVLIVVVKGVFGGDVYAAVGMPWVLANVGFGLAFVLAAVWVSRRWADRFRQSRFLSQLVDDLAGRSLATAMGHIADVAKFQSDETA